MGFASTRPRDQVCAVCRLLGTYTTIIFFLDHLPLSETTSSVDGWYGVRYTCIVPHSPSLRMYSS